MSAIIKKTIKYGYQLDTEGAPSSHLHSLLRQILALVQQNQQPPAAEEIVSSNTYVVRTALKPMAQSDALDVLQQYLNVLAPHDDISYNSSTTTKIPLSAIRAAKSLLSHMHASSSSNDANCLTQKLEQALAPNTTKPHFTISYLSPNTNSPSKSKNPSNRRTPEEEELYQKRIERLKLLEQERKYSNLTSNIEKQVAPDASIRGMMYATSIGLNMIIAPLSFGAFMYFFSGSLLSWVVDDDDSDSRAENGKLDIRRVIVAVISGVIMLFIEMILFVIRNHEMDRHITKKMRVEKPNPFGYVKQHAKRTYTGE